MQSIKGVYGHVDFSDQCVTLCLCSDQCDFVRAVPPSGLSRNVDFFLVLLSLNSIMNHALFITKF